MGRREINIQSHQSPCSPRGGVQCLQGDLPRMLEGSKVIYMYLYILILASKYFCEYFIR